MEVLILIFYYISFWYLFNILWLIVGFSKAKTFHHHSIIPKTKFSIIVPFRNEKETLPKLLHSIAKLNYPTALFEVILVDDASEEKFEIQNTKHELTLIDNFRKTNSPKKDAINTAITIAKYDWIISTDADCEVPENWLAVFDAFIQKEKVKMIASGVMYNNVSGFLDTFQQMDLLSLQGTTIGSFGNQQAFMCNGANFCYQKTFFLELNGFEGNDSIASGDDVFLLQKAILKEVKSVHFLKSNQAIVTTKTEKNWKNLFFQRVRWASKTANYQSIYSKQLGLSVLAMNMILVFSIVLGEWRFFLVLFSIKFWIDFILLFQTSSFFKTSLKHFLLSSLVYPFFSTSVALYSFFGKYTWKGRVFRK
ncbi:glycosyltransferase [Flavobacterium amnicola]|uniref:Glycosyltransferase n=1 Tax=Flavobacterium amnicola TaxID=2506422 RepID=A0A4V1N1T7_9FLAO|nr:glycosyltransferase [Flavobacterium amnicola]RXR17895.1 glycosyltransferase [Flavobacterium amnicola]